MKKIIFGTFLFSILMLILQTVSHAHSVYMDVPSSSWYEDSLNYLIEKNIVLPESTNNIYNPEYFLTRAEGVAFVFRATGMNIDDYSESSYFCDVSPGVWYKDMVELMGRKGYLEGYVEDGCSHFHAAKFMTRAEVIALFLRSVDVHPRQVFEQDTRGLTDVSPSDWFAPYMVQAYEIKLITPDLLGGVRPNHLIRRSEMAVIAARMASMFGKVLEDKNKDSSFEITGERKITYADIEKATYIDENTHVRGSMDAPLVITEYGNLQDPYSARFHATMKRIMEVYPGQILWVYKHMPLDGIHPYARRAAIAAECAGEQGRFFPFVDRIFEQQDVPDLTVLYDGIIQELGMNSDAFNECIESVRHRSTVQDDFDEGVSRGATGTPQSYLNGEVLGGAVPYEEIELLLDQSLKNGGYYYALGNIDSPVIIEMYGDLEDPFSPRFFQSALALLEEFEGQILFLYKHFPLDEIHANSRSASIAAECAGEQGVFFEFIEILYDGKVELHTSSYKKIIRDMGLNSQAFDSCFQSGSLGWKVQADYDEAVLKGAAGVPHTLLNGEELGGAIPYPELKALTEEVLNEFE